MLPMQETLKAKDIDLEKLTATERNAYELNQAFIDSAPYVIGLWNENGKIISISKQAIKMFGVSDPQMIVDNFFCVSPDFQPCGTPSPIKAAEQINRAYIEEYVRFDWLHKTAGGEPLPAECIFKRFTHNDKDMLLSCTMDLRGIKEAEKKEREAQAALKYRETLLSTVNRVAEILLTTNEKDTMKALLAGIEILGKCVDVDRVQIWCNELVDDELSFVMRYEWLSGFGGAGNRIPTLGVKVPDRIRARWLEVFLKGECINGPISKLPPEDAAFLGHYKVVSTAMLPLVLNNEFFGFFGIDDCRRERTFTNDEMAIFASAGLMFTNVFDRNVQRELAFTDVLTGIGNRRWLIENAEQELRNCIDENMNFTVIMIDIDHFKSINDRYGHTIGDAVLKIFASRIRHVLKHETLVARYGGEEFAVTLSGVDHEAAINTAWRIQKTIEASAFHIEDLEIFVTASFGVSSKTSSCTTLSDIIDKADTALYQAKKVGRNKVVDYRRLHLRSTPNDLAARTRENVSSLLRSVSRLKL